MSTTSSYNLSNKIYPLFAYFLLILAGYFLYIFKLDLIPNAVHGDVGEIAATARNFNYMRDFFIPSWWWNIPGGMFFFESFFIKISFDLFHARISDAILGICFGLILYRYFIKSTDKFTALCFTLMVISSAQIIHSFRLGLCHAMPLLIPVLYTYLINLKRTNTISINIGLLLGFSFYMYLPSRAIFPISMALLII